MHVKTLPDSLAATSRDAGCGFSIAWMELTVIFRKIAWQRVRLLIYISFCNQQRPASRLEPPGLRRSTSRRITILCPTPEGVWYGNHRMVWRETGKDSALWRNYWDLLRWRLGQYPRRWSRTREGTGRSSRRVHCLLATSWERGRCDRHRQLGQLWASLGSHVWSLVESLDLDK